MKIPTSKMRKSNSSIVTRLLSIVLVLNMHLVLTHTYCATAGWS